MSVDAVVAQLCSRQYGIISSNQLLEAGLSYKAIRHRVERGRLIRVHPNVFMIGGAPPGPQADLMAACFWSGTGVASHRSAGALWNLDGMSFGRRPEILVPGIHLPPRSGILVHSTSFLHEKDRKRKAGIPVTSVERTLLDLGAVVAQKTVASALDGAVRRGATTLSRLRGCLARYGRRGRRGCGVLRRLLDARDGISVLPHSPLESRFFELLSSSGLPSPELQHVVTDEGKLVARLDFAWPAIRFAVEMDGYNFHSDLRSFARDRVRGNDLTLLGWKVVRGTWDDAESDPEGLLLRVEKGYRLAASQS